MMVARSVLLATTGSPSETTLLATLSSVPSRLVVARRCLDLADLLAVAAAGQSPVALVAAELRRFDSEAVARLASVGVTAIGVVQGADEAVIHQLAAIGVRWTLTPDATLDDVVRLFDEVVAAPAPAEVNLGMAVPGLPALPARHGLPALEPSAVDSGVGPESGQLGGTGRLIAVWGPAGSPGRTSVALAVADELACCGTEVLLADADTYGPSLAQRLALLDEGSGLAAAVRAANSGVLSVAGLASRARNVRPGLRVLTGLTRPDRWPELRPAALSRVWATARQIADWTIVDCGFCLEQDEELSYDTAAPRRNAATSVTLAAADVVLIVAAADPVSIGRVIRELPEVCAQSPQARHQVVVTQVRSGVVGPHPDRQLLELLARHGAPARPVLVPEDRPAFDAALLAGRTLRESAPKSPATAAFASLAARLSVRRPAKVQANVVGTTGLPGEIELPTTGPKHRSQQIPTAAG